MMRTAMLAALALLAACSDKPEAPAMVDNRIAPAGDMPRVAIRNQAIATPITETSAIAVPTATAKPLVSRETEPSQAPSSHAAPAYRAIGTEPFWAVTIRGSIATLERPDKPARRYPVSRHDDAQAIRFLGDGFTMTLTPGPCSDGMSDSIWSDRVQIAFGEGTLKGCGGDREDIGDGPP